MHVKIQILLIISYNAILIYLHSSDSSDGASYPTTVSTLHHQWVTFVACKLAVVVVDVSVAYNSTSLLQSSSRFLKELTEKASTTLADNLFHVGLLILWLKKTSHCFLIFHLWPLRPQFMPTSVVQFEKCSKINCVHYSENLD